MYVVKGHVIAEDGADYHESEGITRNFAVAKKESSGNFPFTPMDVFMKRGQADSLDVRHGLPIRP